VPDTVKCECPECGAKYRLPVETQGRSVRCKRCDNKFRVPRSQTTVEDSVLSWLADGGQEDEVSPLQPRVIHIPNEPKAPPSGAPGSSEAGTKALPH
jgi:hypothetical protein